MSKVEACKICDNNHAYCKFGCNCDTLVEVGGDEPKLTPEQEVEVKKLLHYVEDIKITAANFFPNPPEMYKEVQLGTLMGPEAAKHMKAWEHNGLMIIASVGKYEDGREWLHISVSRKSRLPTYDEITRIKRDFIGDDRKAVTVLPEKKYHVNLHENCLHLFYSEDNPLPEFSAGLGTI